MVHGMKYARCWGAVADHSGDTYFDVIYRSGWPNTLNELANHWTHKRRAGPINVREEERKVKVGLDDGRVKNFLKAVWTKEKLSSAEVHCLMDLCMAATYDPDPKAPNGFLLPFNLETGELLEARWRQWLRHDPIHLVKRYRTNLKTLKGIFIDCGWRDQYHIQYGSRILSKRLREHRIEHTYEEFDDTHSGIDYRMDRSLPFLYRALRP